MGLKEAKKKRKIEESIAAKRERRNKRGNKRGGGKTKIRKRLISFWGLIKLGFM